MVVLGVHSGKLCGHGTLSTSENKSHGTPPSVARCTMLRVMKKALGGRHVLQLLMDTQSVRLQSRASSQGTSTRFVAVTRGAGLALSDVQLFASRSWSMRLGSRAHMTLSLKLCTYVKVKFADSGDDAVVGVKNGWSAKLPTPADDFEYRNPLRRDDTQTNCEAPPRSL